MYKLHKSLGKCMQAHGPVLEHSGTFCMYFGTFWNILHTYSNYLAVFSNWVTDGQTDGQTYIRTCRAASSQLKMIIEIENLYLQPF